jgi:DDE family transposase
MSGSTARAARPRTTSRRGRTTSPPTAPTSCHQAEANQFRLFLHAGAYWLLWSMRRLMPKGSTWRVMQFDTLRLKLIKIAARVVELKKRINIHLPSSAPDQAILGMTLNRSPRLVT